MTTTYANPETQGSRADTFERLGPEAIAYMATEGYAVIDGPQSSTEATELVDQLNPALFLEISVQNSLVEDRKRYALTTLNTPSLVASLQSQIIDDVRGGSVGRAKLSKQWKKDDQAGVPAFTTELYQYKDGTSFDRHTDDPDDGFPTQVLTTLQGQATFEMYDNIGDTVPKASIPLRPGTKILLRGDDMPGGQLPHAVKDNGGDRILMSVYPNRDFDTQVNRALGFGGAGKRLAAVRRRQHKLGARVVRALRRQ